MKELNSFNPSPSGGRDENEWPEGTLLIDKEKQFNNNVYQKSKRNKEEVPDAD